MRKRRALGIFSYSNGRNKMPFGLAILVSVIITALTLRLYIEYLEER